jgi:elongation factor G
MGAQGIADIRNVAFVGHSAAGKTTLAEAILFRAGVTTRLGNVDEGSSILDHEEEARERRHSIDSAPLFVEHQGKLLNIIDTPGMPDYNGPAIAALSAVETAVVVVSAASGIGVNTRRMFNSARDFGLARMVVISRIDAENVNLEEMLSAVRETFGHECHPINLPTNGGRGLINVFDSTEGDSDLGDAGEAHTALIDAIVETDDSLMTEYMDTGSVSMEKLGPAIGKAVQTGHVIPVLFVSSRGDVGVSELMDALVMFAPSPIDGKRRLLKSGEGDNLKEMPIEPKVEGPFIAQVFKITSDPKSNIKYSVARVHSGHLKGDGQVFVSGDRKGQRPGHIFKLRGDQHPEIPEARAGDIVAFAKLDLHIGSVLLDHAGDGTIDMPRFPKPMFALAIEAKARGDIEKVGAALHRFAEEDKCFEYHRDPETHELVIQGLGDMHLTVIRSRMKRYYKLEVETKPPKIPYRETIAGSAKYVEYTHKKQSGGAGQFGRVFIDLEPQPRGEGYLFEDKIFGGVIDLAFRPSVDKGIREQLKKGVVAGYPVVDVKVSLVDGKTHPVDSKDIAFQIAGRQAFKKAFAMSKPIMLEPIVNIEITVPTENMGDITRDVAGKRGHILSQDILPGGQVSIKATVPLAEVASYSSQLKSVTGGQGSYVMEFSHYDVVPPNVQQQIVAAHKPKEEEE